MGRDPEVVGDRLTVAPGGAVGPHRPGSVA